MKNSWTPLDGVRPVRVARGGVDCELPEDDCPGRARYRACLRMVGCTALAVVHLADVSGMPESAQPSARRPTHGPRTVRRRSATCAGKAGRTAGVQRYPRDLGARCLPQG